MIDSVLKAVSSPQHLSLGYRLKDHPDVMFVGVIIGLAIAAPIFFVIGLVIGGWLW